VDPFWPIEPAYCYAKTDPATVVDRTGRQGAVRIGCMLLYCQSVCDKLESESPSAVGETICCAGRPYICIYQRNLENYFGHRGVSPLIIGCIKGHERIHERLDTDVCTNRPDGKIPSDPEQECAALFYTVICLVKIEKRNLCARDPYPAQCRADVDRLRRNFCDQLKGCGYKVEGTYSPR
jgi:hypothetical protein